MQENRISVVIPQDVQDSIIANLQAVKAALAPFLHPLKDEDRKKLSKIGDKSLPFVQKCTEYAATNGEFLPKYVDLGEMQKDVTGFTAVNPIANLLDQLTSDVDDTKVLLGSEGYEAARAYYASVKYAALKQANSSAKPIYEDLAQRFEGQGKGGSNSSSTEKK